MKSIIITGLVLLQSISYAGIFDNVNPMDYYQVDPCDNPANFCVEVDGQMVDVTPDYKKQINKIVEDKYSKVSYDQVRDLNQMNRSELIDLINKNDNGKNGPKPIYIPLSLTNQELIMLAASTSLGLVIFNKDQEVMDFIQDTRTETTQQVADVANLFGKEAVFPIVLGSYFVGLVFDNGNLKQVGLIGVGAGLATQLATEGLKKGFTRKRPNKEDGHDKFFSGEGHYSFASGHTSAAFSLATVFAEVYGDEYPIVPYLSYGVATMTAYARMHDKKHWLTDVIGGAIVGHLVTKLFIRAMEGDENGGLVIAPYWTADGDEFGFNISYTPKKPGVKEFKCKEIKDKYLRVEACMQELFERSYQNL